MPVLEVKGLKKHFAGVQALNGVDFILKKGEAHALVGENGAGKSTLIKSLTGIYRPDGGEILLDGKPYAPQHPREAFDLGISVIHQELNLLPELDVAANIFMGNLPTKRNGLIDKKRMYEEAGHYLELLGLDFSPRTKIKKLSISQAQMVEIAKSLSHNAKIIFMDEPTSSLSPTEQEKLFQVIRDLKERGVSITYVSHRLEEIMDICDRVTILRDGQLVTSMDIKDTNMDEIITRMVGRDLSNRYPKMQITPGETLLEVKHLSKSGVLHDISFSARAGEILGISGFVGAGRTELVRAVFGADPVDSGEILIEGKKVQIRNVTDAVNHGIALLTEDRKNQGLLLNMSIKDNISVSGLNCIKTKPKFFKGPFVDKKAVAENAKYYVDVIKIKTPSLKQLVKNLSGGNQQKVILGKWMSVNAKIIIFDEPTRGIDIGAKAEIYMLMEQLAKAGAAIIMISSELPEILNISDRILVMRYGHITARLTAREATEELIIHYCAKEVKDESTA